MLSLAADNGQERNATEDRNLVEPKYGITADLIKYYLPTFRSIL